MSASKELDSIQNTPENPVRHVTITETSTRRSRNYPEIDDTALSMPMRFENLESKEKEQRLADRRFYGLPPEATDAEVTAAQKKATKSAVQRIQEIEKLF